MEGRQSEYLYPEFSDRSSPTVWAGSGKPDPLHNAIARKNEILQKHFPDHVSDQADRAIRDEFPIFLSPGAMGRN